MTREEATAIWREVAFGELAEDAKKTIRPLVVDRAIDAMAKRDIAGFVALGMLRFDEQAPKQTLWELLRKHQIDLTTAQHICNDAMNNGVSVPWSPQESVND